MKEQIQQLIADGRTEEALALLAQQSSDALLLQARYNNGKKQYNMGLIEFSEWQRTQAASTTDESWDYYVNVGYRFDF